MQTQILVSCSLDILIEMTGFYISALYSTSACSLSRCTVYSFVKIPYKFHTSPMHFTCLEVRRYGFIIEFLVHRMQNSTVYCFVTVPAKQSVSLSLCEQDVLFISVSFEGTLVTV
jgi:hypothetical protein